MPVKKDAFGQHSVEMAWLVPGTPEQLGAIIERDLAHWKKLIVEAKLSFE